MTPKLQKMRDELAKKYWSKFDDKQRWDVYGDFNAGFTAAHDLLMPVIEEMEDALRLITQEPQNSMGDSKGIASEALKKLREILE